MNLGGTQNSSGTNLMIIPSDLPNSSDRFCPLTCIKSTHPLSTVQMNEQMEGKGIYFTISLLVNSHQTPLRRTHHFIQYWPYYSQDTQQKFLDRYLTTLQSSPEIPTNEEGTMKNTPLTPKIDIYLVTPNHLIPSQPMQGNLVGSLSLYCS